MRTKLSVGVVCAVMLAVAQPGRAEDDAKAIIAKAIKAHGVDKKTAGKKAVQTKTKGNIEVGGNSIGFTQQVSIQPPDKLRDVMGLVLNGMNITQTTVYDGKKLWVNVAGQTLELKDKYIDAVKEVVAMMKIMELTFLEDKTIKLESLGEAMVGKKPALGVRVSGKGLKEVNLYFDKKTSLLAKVERRTVDPMTEKEITEERIISEYQKIDGRMMAKKVIVNRDGKKFLDAEVTEIKFVDKLDDSEFVKP